VIDYWRLAREFTRGDCVQKLTVNTGFLSPYVGTVTAVHKGLGVVDVQWPFGNERCFPDDIVRVSKDFIIFIPPAFDQSPRTYDIEMARKEASSKIWKTTQFQPEMYLKLAKYWHNGVSEVIAYDNLYRELPNVEDEPLRKEVAKFYLFAKNSGELRVQQHISKQISKNAAYWVAQNRQYRATGEDIKVGRPTCPRCSSRMKRSTYKMNEGARHKVFACPKCLYLIDPQSVLGPTGEPHNWFGTGV
jgi:ribosomal protein S27AE